MTINHVLYQAVMSEAYEAHMRVIFIGYAKWWVMKWNSNIGLFNGISCQNPINCSNETAMYTEEFRYIKPQQFGIGLYNKYTGQKHNKIVQWNSVVYYSYLVTADLDLERIKIPYCSKILSPQYSFSQILFMQFWQTRWMFCECVLWKSMNACKFVHILWLIIQQTFILHSPKVANRPAPNSLTYTNAWYELIKLYIKPCISYHFNMHCVTFINSMPY